MHPSKLCNAMWDYSQDAVGSKLVTGKIVEAISDDDGSIQGVKLDDGTAIVAEALVVACGPWTHVARTWFGSDVGNRIPRMNGIKVIGRVALEVSPFFVDGSRHLLATNSNPCRRLPLHRVSFLVLS